MFKVTATIIIIVSGFIFSCRKKDASETIITGAYSLEAHVIHHTWDVSHVMIYLKKNATSFPGPDTSAYDMSGMTDGYGRFTFEKLHPGNYYLYVSGYDIIWEGNVTGEMAVQVNSEQAVDFIIKTTIIASE